MSNELKKHHINEVMDMHNLTRGKMGFSIVYYANDVDALLAEKDKEIRRLKRALWLSRANYCHHFRVGCYIRIHPNTMQNEKIMENKMIIAEMNCRAKAEEYK